MDCYSRNVCAGIKRGLLITLGVVIYSTCLGSAGGEGEKPMASADPSGTGKLKLTIVDISTARPTPARVRLKTEDGFFHRPGNSLKLGKEPPYAHFDRSGGREEFFYSPAELETELPAGKYSMLVEKGFEYRPWETGFELAAGKTVAVRAELCRWVNMPEEGWMGGDYHSHFGRSLPGKSEQILELQKAEDLRINYCLMSQSYGKVQNIQPAFGEEGSVYSGGYSVHAAEEYTNDGYGHLAFIDIPQLVEPVATGDRAIKTKADYPANYDQAKKARDIGGTVVACHGGHGEFPVDLALGVIDAVEILQGNRWQRWYGNEELFTPHWYHALNCGFKIPGTAGSDYPVLRDKILGQVRNYVYVGEDFSPRAWIDGLKKGRFFVTNGAMMLEFAVDGKMPGETIKLKRPGEKIQISVRIRSLYPLGRLEVIRNGVVIREVANPDKKLVLEYEEEIPIHRSSWIAVRARGRHPEKTRGWLYIHGNPVYLEIRGKPVLVADSAVWWIEKIDELITRTEKEAVFDREEDRQRTLRLFRKGRRYYEKLIGIRE